MTVLALLSAGAISTARPEALLLLSHPQEKPYAPHLGMCSGACDPYESSTHRMQNKWDLFLAFYLVRKSLI